MTTQRLPVPGQDDGTWGTILNGFLGVAHNPDGTLQAASDISTAKTQAASAVQSVNGKTPTTGSLTLNVADIADVQGGASATNSQVLAYNGAASKWVPSTITSTTVSDATTSVKGIVQLGGDLAGAGTSATTPVITAGAITTNKLATGAVTTNEIADGTITNTDINAAAAIARTKLDSSTQTSLGKADTALQSAPVSSVNTRTGAITLTSTDVGLANVDNTSDATKNSAAVTLTNKTISGASNTLSNIPESAVTSLTTDLAAKAPLASPTFTGTPTAPTPSNGDNSTNLATTAYVGSVITTTQTAPPTVRLPNTFASGGDAGAPIQAILNANLSGVTIIVPPGTYPQTTSVTISPLQQVVTAAGRHSVKYTYSGSGTAWTITTANFASPGANGRRGAKFEGTIDGTSAGAGAIGLMIGVIEKGDADCHILNFSGTGSIGLLFQVTSSGTDWYERSRVWARVDGCTNAIIFDGNNTPTGGSHGYCDFRFEIFANANQNGVAVVNGAQIIGSQFVLTSSSFRSASSTNTGIALKIGDSSYTNAAGSILNCDFFWGAEVAASGFLGHKDIVIGSSGVFNGNVGLIRNLAPFGSWQVGTISGAPVSFNGYIQSPAFATATYGGPSTNTAASGGRIIGDLLTMNGSTSGTTMYGGGAFRHSLTLASGTNTVAFGSSFQKYSVTPFHIILTQPSSGAAGTVATWPAGFTWVGTSSPTLSATNNAIDVVFVIPRGDGTNFDAYHVSDNSSLSPAVVTNGTTTASTRRVVFANGTSTVTLSASTAGDVRTVKNTGTGTITISPATGTIDGAATATMNGRYQAMRYLFDGTNWFTLDAPLNSPSLTGTPVAPTPATSDNSTTIATTGFVRNAITAYASGSGSAATNTALGSVTGTASLDLSTGARSFTATLTGDTAFSTANWPAGAPSEVEVVLSQDSTGKHVATFSGITWLSGGPYLTPTANAVSEFTLFSPDGTTLYGFAKTSPVPTSAGLETISRRTFMNARGGSAGFIVLCYFPVLDHDITITNLVTHVSGTVSSGLTIGMMGIVEWDGTNNSNNHKTVAKCANDTTLWNTAGLNERAITLDGSGASISSLTLRAGHRYAGAVLMNGTTLAQLTGIGVATGTDLYGSDGGVVERITGVSATGSQTDFPATFTISTANYSGSAYYFRVN